MRPFFCFFVVWKTPTTLFPRTPRRDISPHSRSIYDLRSTTYDLRSTTHDPPTSSDGHQRGPITNWLGPDAAYGTSGVPSGAESVGVMSPKSIMP